VAPQIPHYPWYGIASGVDVQQGDILRDCPVFSPPQNLDNNGFGEVLRTLRDVIVMTQSCDLANGRSNPDVLLCGLFQRSQIPNDHRLANPSNLEIVRKGGMPAFHLLAPSDLDQFPRELTIVDFRSLFSLPFEFVRRKASQNLHLRLLPPYREHLSQAFARYFMRVGLPVDLPSIR
jgi:hypothetical protein